MPHTKTCTLSLVVRSTGREEVHARTRPLTHASVFLEKEDDDPRPLHLGVTHASVATNCSVLNHPIGSIMDVPIY